MQTSPRPSSAGTKEPTNLKETGADARHGGWSKGTGESNECRRDPKGRLIGVGWTKCYQLLQIAEPVSRNRATHLTPIQQGGGQEATR